MFTFPLELDPAYEKLYEDLVRRSRSNTIPETFAEQLILEHRVEQMSSEIRKYDDAIARLQKQRAQLAKAMTCQKSLLSPIRKLPSDVLIHIFHLVSEDSILFNESPNEKASRTFIGAIFSLTWVCSVWRNLALSQPSLWSSFKLRLQSIDENSRSAIFRELVLSRIGPTTPMQIIIDTSNSYRVPATWNILSQFAGRLKHLKVVVLYVEHFDSLLEMITDGSSAGPCFHCLEHLEFHFLQRSKRKTRSNDTLQSFKHPFLRNCPRLYHLKVPFLNLADSIDLSNLTCLRISFDFGGSLSTLLQKCATLETLQLGWFNAPDNLSSRFPPLCHTYLSTLEITNIGRQRDNSSAFEMVSIPNLAVLAVKCPISCGPGNPFNELRTMLVQSRCTLREVLFEGIPSYVANVFLNDVHISEDANITENSGRI
ncbi:hypothetical protein F5051DRAFT_418819, partial [Lentinula edodes]